MKLQDESSGCLAIFGHDPLALERQYLYTYVRNFLILRGHVIDFLESALPIGRRIDVRLQAADHGTAHELRRYQVAIDEAYALSDGARTREFAQPHHPVYVRTQVDRSCQLVRARTDRVVRV